MTSVVVTTKQCPECAKRGQDTSGDNLAVYSDGHEFCFSCRYYKRAPMAQRARLLELVKPEISETKPDSLNFPDDYEVGTFGRAANWIQKFELTQKEIYKHGIGWSESRQLLCFPVFNEVGALIMWQGRNFAFNKEPLTSTDKFGNKIKLGHTYKNIGNKKYLTYGPASDILHIIEPEINHLDDGDIWEKTVVVVEGVLDAIKVARVCPAMPLWGCHMPLKTIRRLSERFSRMGVWLDRDKRQEAVKTAVRASQYIPVFVTDSAGDPKEYSDPTINVFLRRDAAFNQYQDT